MSLDGKIATYSGDSRMSSLEDLRRVHRLRASVDGIMVGFRTLIVDDPKLTVNYAKGPHPSRIIVDSNAETPLESYVVRTARRVPTLIAVTSKASDKRTEALRNKGVSVLLCGTRPLVSLKILMKTLGKLGLRRILLEGGGTLNWSMLHNGLVDEVRVAITPRILGGVKAVSLAEGEGSRLVRDAVKLKLLDTARYGPDLVVRYKALGSSR
jgi:2,5-diamino-6-(ribosylamino)-4(3H)-pyrimidinone 5'-phosphate reductase